MNKRAAYKWWWTWQTPGGGKTPGREWHPGGTLPTLPTYTTSGTTTVTVAGTISWQPAWQPDASAMPDRHLEDRRRVAVDRSIETAPDEMRPILEDLRALDGGLPEGHEMVVEMQGEGSGRPSVTVRIERRRQQ